MQTGWQSSVIFLIWLAPVAPHNFSEQQPYRERIFFRQWIEAYGRAWESRDPEAAAELYTYDGTYQVTPFLGPLRGRQAIRDYWTEATRTEKEITFGYEILAVTEQFGIARWHASFLRTPPFVSVNACYRQFLAQAWSQQDTDLMETLRRSIPISAAIVVIVGVSWLGLRYFRSQIDCKKLSAAFARQVENIKEDAHERLKIGTKKADVARFFAEHSIPFNISESEARGTLWTSGCAPFGCGSDSALIGVSVKLDPAGAVTEEPAVIGTYTDCQ